MKQELILRTPISEDGIAVFDLIARCPPLDPNSMYCNLLQCSHFADTSVAALNAEDLVGFISGYIIPKSPQTLFIWQLAVDERMRGQGLAAKMLHFLLHQSSSRDVSFVETTITEDNQASWAVFEKLAKSLKAELNHFTYFDRKTHFHNRHASEILVKIGPFKNHK